MRKARVINGGGQRVFGGEMRELLTEAGKQMFHSHVQRVMNSPHNDSRMCWVERQRGGGRGNKTEAGE